jgi:hypothetical protein
MFQFELLTKRDWALVVVFTVALAMILGGAFYWAFSRAYSVGPPTKAAIGSVSPRVSLGGEGFALKNRHAAVARPQPLGWVVVHE